MTRTTAVLGRAGRGQEGLGGKGGGVIGEHLQDGVGACVLVGGPAATTVLVGQDDVDALEEALIHNWLAHCPMIQPG